MTILSDMELIQAEEIPPKTYLDGLYYLDMAFMYEHDLAKSSDALDIYACWKRINKLIEREEKNCKV